MKPIDLIPAIDLQQGKAVRLMKGDHQAVTVYDEDPVRLCREWARETSRLHVVDLEGSRRGSPQEQALISAMVGAFGRGVQVGGGVRSLETLRQYFALGVERVVLGSAALTQPALVMNACREFPNRVVLAVDARAGLVATEGWEMQSKERAVDVVRRFASAGLAAVLYTDIERDGTEVGPNLEATIQLSREGGVPVMVSGGVGTLDHLRAIARAEAEFAGVIVGRALHERRFTIQEAKVALERR